MRETFHVMFPRVGVSSTRCTPTLTSIHIVFPHLLFFHVSHLGRDFPSPVFVRNMTWARWWLGLLVCVGWMGSTPRVFGQSIERSTMPELQLILEDPDATIPPLTVAMIEPDWDLMMTEWVVLHSSTLLCKMMDAGSLVMDSHVGEPFQKFMEGRDCEEDMDRFETLELHMSQLRLVLRMELVHLEKDIDLHRHLQTYCETLHELVQSPSDSTLDTAKYESFRTAFSCDRIPVNMAAKETRYKELQTFQEVGVRHAENTMKLKIDAAADAYATFATSRPQVPPKKASDPVRSSGPLPSKEKEEEQEEEEVVLG